jgi:hypothetical protein
LNVDEKGEERMTDNEIIKALERVKEQYGVDCYECKYKRLCKNKVCPFHTCDYALDLIKRQQAEIAELKVETERLDMNKWWKEKLSELQKPLLKAYNQFRLDEAVKERTKELQAEIEKKDRILESYALQYGTAVDKERIIKAELEKLHPYKLHYGNLKTEIVHEFADRVCADRVCNDPVVIAVRCMEKEMTEET